MEYILEVDYLGSVDVENKYLEMSSNLINCLLAQVKLIDNKNSIKQVLIDLNLNSNSLIVFKEKNVDSIETILKHKLSDLHKISCLENDPKCFGYFYPKSNTSSFFSFYTLHVFYSNKSNLSQVLNELQIKCFKLHENLIYEKLFDFKLITKLVLNQDELNIPNFIEICLEKALKQQNQTRNLLNLKSKTKLFLTLSENNKRVLLKFGANRLYIQETDQEPIEQEYKNVLYLNNSITNENFFCLAYSHEKSANRLVNAFILYSNNVETIDNVIREYAINVSSELNNLQESSHTVFHHSPELHECSLCPIKQFISLINKISLLEYNDQQSLYNFLTDKINHLNTGDKCFINDSFLNLKNNLSNQTDLNQLLVCLIYKLCKKKQAQHLIDEKNSEFNLNQSFRSSKTCLNGFKAKKRTKLKRSNTLNCLDHVLNDTNSFKQSKSSVNFLNINFSNRVSNSFIKLEKISCKKYMFNKIVGSPIVDQTQTLQKEQFKLKRFKTSQEVRQFWKKLITEQIILIKMEKENRKMGLKAAYSNKTEYKINFNYIEITPCLKEVDKQWELLMEQDESNRPSLEDLKKIVFRGIPQSKREKIWFWLIKQYKLRISKTQSNSKCELINQKSYKELLKQTTIHQHAILLDLGRTFPNHSNFSKKYGPGQLALFNVLKSYSILDPEVGYCQGLSFIVGILLIHVNNNEEKAFELLKFLLIDLNLREQYKPDMIQLQKHMFQFTRLLNDNCFDIYSHLEENDVSSSLYAAPWFLTLFSSQFQIGFVARVFDFLFCEGPIVLFKISISILSIHKPLLLSCDSFESVVNHIKTTIPEMSLIESELIVNRVNSYDDVLKELNKYEIEFNLLYEEFLSQQSGSISFDLVENMDKMKLELKDLKEKNKLLMLQLNNQNELFYSILNENKRLKTKLDSMETEKVGLLKKLKDQDRLINNLI